MQQKSEESIKQRKDLLLKELEEECSRQVDQWKLQQEQSRKERIDSQSNIELIKKDSVTQISQNSQEQNQINSHSNDDSNTQNEKLEFAESIFNQISSFSLQQTQSQDYLNKEGEISQKQNLLSLQNKNLEGQQQQKIEDENANESIQADDLQNDKQQTNGAKKKGSKGKKNQKNQKNEKGDGINQNNQGNNYNLRQKIKNFQMQKQNEITYKKQRVGVVYDEEMLLHKDYEPGHPERPERVQAIYLNLVKKKLWDDLVMIDAYPADDSILSLAHSQNHIQKVKDTMYNNNTVDGKKVEMKKFENTNRFSQDTYENKFTAQAAYLSAGGTVEAIRALCQKSQNGIKVLGGKGRGSYGDIDSVFAIVRPPGHHAHCSIINGFCFFNNVAIAAKVAQKEFNKKKICIFDWDIHVGDGTSQIFYNDDTVLYISIHRFDMGKFFPGPKGKHEMIGECKGKGYNIQFPFNMPNKNSSNDNESLTIGDNDYIYVCDQFLFPIIRKFDPDMIIISAGFDSAKGDPLGGISISPIGYAWITQGLRNIQSCLAVVLEGGYSLEALEVSSESVFKVLKTHPKDNDSFNKILENYGATEENNSYEKLQQLANQNPRFSFKVTISNLSKLLRKTWGEIVEHLIFEKPRRKSSAQSDHSMDKNSDGALQSHHNLNSNNGSFRSRVLSMDDQESKGIKGVHEIDFNLKSLQLEKYISQIDDPIDEKDEIDREERKKQMSNRNKN